jgi:hypothetical protein
MLKKTQTLALPDTFIGRSDWQADRFGWVKVGRDNLIQDTVDSMFRQQARSEGVEKKSMMNFGGRKLKVISWSIPVLTRD